MAERARWPLGNGCAVHTVFSDADDGDLAVDAPSDELAARRAALVPTPWTWLHQVHGARVVRVGAEGDRSGARADASYTTVAGAALAVHVADCAPVLLWAPHDGAAVVAAVHAGWRGLRAGVIGATVAAVVAEGIDPSALRWTIGPCICASHYEFTGPELEEMAGRFGGAVRSRTESGAPALDLRAAVAGALAASGVTEPASGATPACTLESERHWSFRGESVAARQVGLIWWEAA
jgi:YfiH family protein